MPFTILKQFFHSPTSQHVLKTDHEQKKIPEQTPEIQRERGERVKEEATGGVGRWDEDDPNLPNPKDPFLFGSRSPLGSSHTALRCATLRYATPRHSPSTPCEARRARRSALLSRGEALAWQACVSVTP